MKKKAPDLIFSLIILIVVVWALIVSFRYPVKAMIFPVIALLFAFVLLCTVIIRNIFNLDSKHKPDEAKNEGKEEEFTIRHLGMGLWMVGIPLMLWLIGFMGTVILFPFLYLRFMKESWLLSIVLPLSCWIFFYVLFGLILSLPLYPGMLAAKILG